MPAQSDRVINLRVQATDDGATGTLSKIGKAAEKELNGAAGGSGGGGGAGGGGLLSQLKGGFGRGSTFTQSLKVLQGGGAILGLTLAGKEIGAFAEHARTLQEELAKGDKSTGEIIEDLGKGLPVIGGWVKAGREFREIIDGSAAEVAKLNRENAAMTAALDAQRKLMELGRQNAKELGDELRKTLEATRLLNLREPTRSLAALGDQEREDQAKVSADIAKRRSEIQKTARGAIDEVGKHLNTTNPPGPTDTLGGKFAVGFNPRSLSERDLEAEAAEARRRALSQQGEIIARQEGEQTRALAEKELQIRLAKGAEYATRASQLLERDGEAREAVVRQQERDIADLQVEAQQDALKRLGKDRDAFLLGLRREYQKAMEDLAQQEKLALGNALNDREAEKIIERFARQAEAVGEVLNQRAYTDAAEREKKRRESLTKQFNEGLKSILDPIASFKGKDAIDFLLRKMGLKGGVGYVDRSLPLTHPDLPGLTSAVQVSQGGSRGYAIAEQLGSQANADPLRQTAKNTQDTAKEVADMRKAIDGLSSLFREFSRGIAQKIGITPPAKPA